MSATLPTSQEFSTAFDRFQELYEAESGHRFINFKEGRAAAWENYKIPLRRHALSLLKKKEWDRITAGNGNILRNCIDAIEIQDTHKNLTNNLVFWPNRFGHANRDHYTLLDALENDAKAKNNRQNFEQLLFDLFHDKTDESTVFNDLAQLTGRKYPLLAYLFFLKDSNRFTPIAPTGFDRGFAELGIEFKARGACSWENYSSFLVILEKLRPLIVNVTGLEDVSLIDAHSFVWIFAELVKRERGGTIGANGGTEGRILGSREKSIVEMCMSVKETASQSNGQTVSSIRKNKELPLNDRELESLLDRLLKKNDNRCALTGLPFSYSCPNVNKNMLPSVDRIDSNGHYSEDNIQIVCRFVNFWKGATENEEFKDLLALVRDPHSAE